MKKTLPPKSEKKPLKRVTLREFLDSQGKGSRKAMADALDVSKSLISNLAKAPDAGGEQHFTSYRLAKRIRAYVERHGFTIDIEEHIRTERA